MPETSSLFGGTRSQSEPPVGWWRQLSPSQLFIGSFLLLIAVGTIGFKVLPGLYTGEPLRWLDALFTATSAVCVTGLIVVDTETFFTTAGQAWILLLIQLGGLGMFTFTSLIIVALGRRLSLRSHALSSVGAKVVPDIGPVRLTRNIVLFTFAFETVGAILLYVCWVPTFGWQGAIWHSVFQAVSAFCNAGFSTFSTSLVAFNRDPWILGVVTAGIFVFSATELPWAEVPGSGFLYYMFEASSAFNTVGLSMGVTTYLSDPGRLTTIILMFIGRVGPLTVAAALARPAHKRRGPRRYAYEDVVVG